MIALVSYLISVMVISMVLRASNLSIELEAHHTCSKQVLAFVKKAQVRVSNIQFPCCNRDTTSMMVPLGRHSMALRLDRVSLGKYTPKEYDHAPVIRVARMKLKMSRGRMWERNFSTKVIRITFGLSLASIVPLEWPSRCTAPVPGFCEMASTPCV